jgi:hypothetical protein
MNWSDLGGWDEYKPPPHRFNHERVPILQSNDHVLWTLRCYRGTSLRRNSSTGSNPSRNLKLRLFLIPLVDNLANPRVRYSSLRLAIHSDDLSEIFWRPFRKSLNPKCERSLLRRPLSQRNYLRRHLQTQILYPLALTLAIEILHPWRKTR